MNEKIKLIKGDITKIKIDAIVNAANSSLLGGGGVDGAIHRAGGKDILEECIKIRNKIGKCKTGQAVITAGGLLKVKYVIHTVGPIWRDGSNNEDELLKLCYINSIKLAEEYKLSTIAFPNISTGVYGFPKERACKIAINTVRECLNRKSSMKEILFVCFDEKNYELYYELLNNKRCKSH
ncbi:MULTISPECIES: O-acetyl-ADP-ribose deacetylase [Clostridium]|uniref:O-acetyl-ADP-ribose deacetylase n=1 Tax=Clostridium TaxID=1485 RepID=UPI000825CA30|nr:MULTISPECIES: O-acetyl-ADP-ribose deacetylase [Clostridium]PJI10111.1 O-acetyl-ADP-ribose deacetylase [Clostridium sp. CT7]